MRRHPDVDLDTCAACGARVARNRSYRRRYPHGDPVYPLDRLGRAIDRRTPRLEQELEAAWARGDTDTVDRLQNIFVRQVLVYRDLTYRRLLREEGLVALHDTLATGEAACQPDLFGSTSTRGDGVPRAEAPPDLAVGPRSLARTLTAAAAAPPALLAG